MIHIDDDNLFAYLDGILTPSEIELVEMHLENCKICAEKSQEIGSLYLLLDTFGEYQIERNLAPDVIAAIETDLVIPSRLKLGIVLQMFLAAVGIVVIVPNISSISWLEIILDSPTKAMNLIQEGFMQVIYQWVFWLALIHEKWSNLMNLTIDVQLSQLPIWPLVLLALLLFFVGNGLIFRKLITNKNRV